MGFSLDFYKKLNWSFGLLLIGTLLGVAAFAAMIEIKDLDLWLHLKMGEFIVRHGYVPSVDVLSCSFAGKPWIDHEWLFQVIVYLVKSAWGFDGLIYMQVLLVMASFVVLLLLTYEEGRELVIAPVLFLVMFVYQTRFTIRPDIFSLSFFVFYIYILSLHLDKRWIVGVFFALQVIWTNIHGYYFLGILLIAIVLLAEWGKRHLKMPLRGSEEVRLVDEEYRRLKWILGASILATLVNPLFLKGAAYPLTVLFGIAGDQAIFFANITELQRPITWATVFDPGQQMPFKALIFLSAISFFWNRRRIDLALVLLWIVFLCFSLTALRNMTYFALVAYFVIMRNIMDLRLDDFLPFRFKYPQFFYLTGLGASIFLIGVFLDYGRELSSSGYYDFSRYERKSEFLGVGQRNFPDRAVDFLVANKIRGNFFNDFNSGAYLIGRAYPDIRVYMDGRTELRGAQFFKTYKKIWYGEDEKLFDEASERYYFSGAFVNTSTASAPSKLIKMLFAKKEWRLVYFDYDAMIFLKDIPQNQDIIKRFSVDLASWRPPELDRRRLADARVFPYYYIHRANTLHALGFDDQALLEADAALKVAPVNFHAFRLKGEIYTARREYENAFENWRLAAVYNGGEDSVLKDLAQAYLDIGDLEGAQKLAKRVIEDSPRDAAGYLVLAQALAKSKQYEKGYDILLQALTKSSPDLKKVLAFADISLSEGKADLAFKVCDHVLKKDIRCVEAYQTLADVHEKMGDPGAALVTLRRAARMAPQNKDLQGRIQALSEKMKEGKG